MRVLCVLAILAVGCESEQCTLGGTEGCGEGQVCESFPGDEPRCTTPLEIEGRVFDLITGVGIEGARVVALDANGGARSGVAFTDVDGNYTLGVSIAREEDGQPTSEAVTLRVDASGYETFAKPPRTALPIDLEGATEESDRWVVANATTDVGLIALETAGDTITGHVDAAEPGGVLVVGVQGDAAVSTSITGSDGSFVLFNVPAGTTAVTGYRGGLTTNTVQAAAGDTGVVLTGSSDGLATVTGSVNIVNAPGGLVTSVILVVEATFNDLTLSGESPAGLRASPVSNAFTIENVPPGRYAVLAAFENDQLVRDPDMSIGGTDLVFIDVAGGTVELPESFKVTEALEVISPGADGLEVVSSAPELVFAQDSSEDGYEIRIYDALGNLVHEDLTLPPGDGSDPIRYPTAGVFPLEAGMIYQFRAWSHKDGQYISTTEDLRGVFHYVP